MRNCRIRSIRDGRLVILAKLRLSLSKNQLATVFRIQSKRAICRIIQEVSRALLKDFVLKYLGFQLISREYLLHHRQIFITTQMMAQRDDQVISVMDGTCLFVQKSSGSAFQRRSFGMHKHRNLIKPMNKTATVSVENQVVAHIVLWERERAH
jgi:hypothetical protein